MTPAPLFNPYPGLRPFQASEAHLFFGRSTHVDELLAELARSRFVAVMGASGSGKSSLVSAGLLPALHGGSSPRAASHWHIASFRPGANPIHNLACALAVPEVLGAGDADPLIAAAQVEATLRRSGLGLADAARRSVGLNGGRLLAVVDQFEELFRFRETATAAGIGNDAEAFVQLLIEASRDDQAPVDVVLTVRSDFLGDCSQFRELPETINDGVYLVPRLTRLQLRDAITGPAAVAGATLSPRLVQRLLNDAGADPDMLPVVQHAMMRTWEVWAREGATGPIHVQHYEACGGVTEALSRHADEAYFELGEGRPRAVAELMFKRITELGEDNREVRRPTPLAEIAAVAGATTTEVEACISHFAEPGRSFVTVSGDGVVDISHESLIRQWPRLRAWVHEESESRDIYGRLADSADRWERREAALLRDPDLQIAASWWTERQPNQAWADRYNPAFTTAADYLDRSRRAARRRRATTVAGVAALAALAVVATLFAFLANHRQDEANRAKVEAQRQERTAISRQLSAASIEAGAPQRSMSILAAVEAVRATEPDGLHLPAAEEALRQSLKGPLGLALAVDPAQPGEVSPVMTASNPDGSLLATAGADGGVDLWRPAEPEAPLQALQQDGAEITALAFGAPDGRWLAAGNAEGVTRLWDVTDPAGQPRVLPPHDQAVMAIAFSADGWWVATAGRDGRVAISSLADRDASPQELPASQGFARAVAFSPDGRLLVAGYGDGRALLWAVDGGTAPRELIGHQSPITSVAFSPDGRWLVTGSTDSTAILWDPADRTAPPIVLQHRAAVTTVAFSRAGDRLATGSDDHTARLWNLRDPAGPRANPAVLIHDDGVDAVAFSPSGRELATGSRDSTARLFDLADLNREPAVLAGHDDAVTSLAFGGDDAWLATGSIDGTARLWDVAHRSTRPGVLTPPSTTDQTAQTLAGVKALAFSPDGRLMATGATDKSVTLWDVGDPPVVRGALPLPPVPRFGKAGIDALAFSPDGRRLATGGGDRTVRLLDALDPEAPPEQSASFPASITALAFSPDGRWLVTAVNHGESVFVSDANDMDAPRQELLGHDDAVTSLAFSQAWLATGSRDGNVRLWALDDLAGDPEVVLSAGGTVTSLAFSRDGGELAAGVGQAVQRWDIGNDGGTLTDQLPAADRVTGVAYSPDGLTLVVAAGRGLEVWDLGVPDRARPIAAPSFLEGHTGKVDEVAYSPDGSHFASASEDGTVRLWQPLPALLDLACQRVGRNLTLREWQQLLPGEPYQATCAEWPPGA